LSVNDFETKPFHQKDLAMHPPLADTALDQLFRNARSLHAFTTDPVTDETLKALYDLLKWGPTAFNAQPARYLFLRSAEAKARLAPALMASNLKKSLAAPVTVIIAQDLDFPNHLPAQYPAFNAKPMYDADPALTEVTAFRNSTLQGAYLLLAARALGLSVGPMSGFDAAKLDAEFFPGGRVRSNFIANMGYGDLAKALPRGPRLAFGEVAQIL
jgi:3-hydroxypropanoate dehydrogenase